MPIIEIEPTGSNDLDPTPRSLVFVKGDLRIIELLDRPVAAFFTEGTDAVEQNLHVLLDGKTNNSIIAQADEHGELIINDTPVQERVYDPEFRTQVKQPYITPREGPHL